jgi:hypothetical protein
MTPDDTSTQAQSLPVQQDPRPREDARCRKRFNDQEVLLLEAIGKLVAYHSRCSDRRFRFVVCPQYFADDCCWILDEDGQLVCVPCEYAFKFSHRPEK